MSFSKVGLTSLEDEHGKELSSGIQRQFQAK